MDSQEKVKNTTEIIMECWEEGSEESKRKLSNQRALIEAFAYNCMERQIEELEKIQLLKTKVGRNRNERP